MFDVSRFQKNPGKIIRDQLKKYYSAISYDEETARGMAILAAQIDRPFLDFRMNKRQAEPEGRTLFCTLFPLKQNVQGRYVIEREMWRWSTLSTLSGGFVRGGMGMYGMYGQPGRIPSVRRPPIMIQGGQDFLWNLITDLPLLEGSIDSLRITMNYEGLNYFLSGRNVTQRNPRATQPDQIDPDSGLPRDSKYELYLRDRITKKYILLSQVSDENGYLYNPGRFLDKLTGTLSFRLSAPLEWGISFPPDIMETELTIDFGTGTETVFLGRRLETDS